MHSESFQVEPKNRVYNESCRSRGKTIIFEMKLAQRLNSFFFLIFYYYYYFPLKRKVSGKKKKTSIPQQPLVAARDASTRIYKLTKPAF